MLSSIGRTMDGVWLIPFTFYKRPSGMRQSFTFNTRVDDVAKKARRILEAGYVFEIEELSTGHISATVTDPEHGDFGHALMANNEHLTSAVEAMILNFDIDKTRELIREMTQEQYDE